ncbi:MAG: hypothetical protein K9N55_11415 [Phycisphaerae bacterium]|nr:hypothetical protein [Phycisphaerae bacterium]
MAQLDKDNITGGRTDSDRTIQEYVDQLTDEHRMLVVLKSQLYGGSWSPMLDDLKNRLEGKPYIFKLVNRINDDIERIEAMQAFEQEHNMDLCDYVGLD